MIAKSFLNLTHHASRVSVEISLFLALGVAAVFIINLWMHITHLTYFILYNLSCLHILFLFNMIPLHFCIPQTPLKWLGRYFFKCFLLIIYWATLLLVLFIIILFGFHSNLCGSHCFAVSS